MYFTTASLAIPILAASVLALPHDVQERRVDLTERWQSGTLAAHIARNDLTSLMEDRSAQPRSLIQKVRTA